MKKGIIVGLAAAALMAGGPALAAIATSVHNLSSSGTGGITSNTNEICIHCHTPHNANGTMLAAPLWNRSTNDNTSFIPYTSSTISSSSWKVNPFTPNDVSLMCLTCHDGTVSDLGSAGGPIQDPADVAVINYTGTMDPMTVLGTDLRTDHPISVPYPPTGKPDFNATPSNGLPLFSSNVECATCHDPHLTTNGKFLRISNAGSAVCLSCHVK